MPRSTSTFSQVKDFNQGGTYAGERGQKNGGWSKRWAGKGGQSCSLVSSLLLPGRPHAESPRSAKPGALHLGGTPVTGFTFLVKNLAVRRCLKYASAEAFLLPKQTSTFVERTFKRKKPIIYKRQHIYMYAADLGDGLGPIEK